MTQNLFGGLQRIRNPSEPIRIWVDALCINQSDLAEQSAQVAHMDQIYANTSPVVVHNYTILRLFKRMQQHDNSGTEKQLASCLDCSIVDEEWDCGCSMNENRTEKVQEPSP